MVDNFLTEKKKRNILHSCSIIIFVIFEKVAFHGDLEEQANEIFDRRKEVHACWGPKQRLCSIKLISKPLQFQITKNNTVNTYTNCAKKSHKFDICNCSCRLESENYTFFSFHAFKHRSFKKLCDYHYSDYNFI